MNIIPSQPTPLILFDDLLALERRAQVIDAPLAGWGGSNANGGSSASLPLYLTVSTSTSSNSSALVYLNCRGFAPATNTYNTWDFSKRALISFNYVWLGVDAEAVGRLHIKNALTAADLVAAGVGIRDVNGVLYGSSYGTASGLVNLGVTLTQLNLYPILIVFTPGVRVDWYVNGSLVGSQTDTTKIPTGTFAANPSLSVINGATGGVACTRGISRFRIVQEF